MKKILIVTGCLAAIAIIGTVGAADADKLTNVQLARQLAEEIAVIAVCYIAYKQMNRKKRGGQGVKRPYTKLTPLTAEERDFAEKNHPFLLFFIQKYEVDYDKYYDVAAVGYLKAVKKWFERPDLHQYHFSTIARQNIRGYIGQEKKREGRRVRTISLDATVKGTNGATLQEIITSENLIYAYDYMGIEK